MSKKRDQHTKDHKSSPCIFAQLCKVKGRSSRDDFKPLSIQSKCFDYICQIFQINKQRDQSAGFFEAHFPVMCMSIVTNVLNFILSYSMDLLSSKLQRHKSKSDRLNSIIIKNVVTQTINTSLIYWILYLRHPSNPLSNSGLFSKVFSLVLISGLINIFWEACMPTYWLKKWYYGWKHDNPQNIELFQYQYNEIVELPEFDYATSYGFYLVYTFLVAIYGFIVPFSTPILILIFIGQYWVDKYQLFNNRSTPVNVSFDFGRMVFRLFQFSIVLYSAAYFFWDLTIHEDSEFKFKLVNFLNLCLAVFYVSFELFAPRSLKQLIYSDSIQVDCLSYKDKHFDKTYRKENPSSTDAEEVKSSWDKKRSTGQKPQAEKPVFFNEQKLYHAEILTQKMKPENAKNYTKQEIELYNRLSNFNRDTENDALISKPMEKIKQVELSKMTHANESGDAYSKGYRQRQELFLNERSANAQAQSKKYKFLQAKIMGPRV